MHNIIGTEENGSKTERTMDEALRELGARALMALHEASDAGAEGWSLEAIRCTLVDKVQTAALSLGLLQDYARKRR